MASAAPSNGRKPALKCPATRGTVKHRPGMFGKDCECLAWCVCPRLSFVTAPEP